MIASAAYFLVTATKFTNPGVAVEFVVTSLRDQSESPGVLARAKIPEETLRRRPPSPVVLLHGIGGSGPSTWQTLATTLGNFWHFGGELVIDRRTEKKIMKEVSLPGGGVATLKLKKRPMRQTWRGLLKAKNLGLSAFAALGENARITVSLAVGPASFSRELLFRYRNGKLSAQSL